MAILNAWVSTGNAQVAEVLARSGFDTVTVDLQHGMADFADMVNCFRGISLGGAKPYVRVPWSEPGILMRTLDQGAEGVICPMISSVDEAKTFVSACRYPFDGGTRSFGPIRAAALHDKYVDQSGKIITTLGMIETRAGYDNVADIARVDGLTGLYIGPSDLSLAFGMPPGQDQRGEKFLAKADHIRKVAHDHGKICAIHCASAEYGKEMADRGFDMVTAMMDLTEIGKAAGHVMSVSGRK